MFGSLEAKKNKKKNNALKSSASIPDLCFKCLHLPDTNHFFLTLLLAESLLY